MVKIAGIENRIQTSGRLIQATPVKEINYTSLIKQTEYEGTIRPYESLYTYDQVIEILRRFDFFKNAYNKIDKGDGGDLAMWYAQDSLKYKYTGSQWSGIDEFVDTIVAEN